MSVVKGAEGGPKSVGMGGSLVTPENASWPNVLAPKMHDGGTVPKDGIYTLQKGEKVIPMKHAGHGFKKTSITHFDDGSAMIHHEHENGNHSTHAVGDLDGVHDSLEEHLRCPEEVEEDLEKRGINPEKIEEKIAPGLHESMDDVIEDK